MKREKTIPFSKKQMEALSKRYPTPFYIYDAAMIRARCRELKRAFPRMRLYYACKANSNPEILRLIHREGFGIECVSPQEIAVARRIGIPPSQIAFTCGAIDERELVSVVRQGVRVHLDSLMQVRYFGENFPGRDISVRLNHGIGAGHHVHTVTGGPDSKFAIDDSQVGELLTVAKKYQLRIVGLHQHIGSGGILKISTALQAIDVQLNAAWQFPYLRYVDFGGGFGVPYRPGETKLPIQELGKKVIERISRFTKQYGREVEMSFEPGRYVVAESGNLVVTVTEVKQNPAKTFVGVNSGMGHLVRPAMYDSHHEIVNVSRPHARREKVTIVGNYCESGDVLAKNRPLPMPEIGDLLMINNAGAYGYTMSSEYNLRFRPAEFLLQNGKFTMIRRAQTLKDYFVTLHF